MGETNNGEVQFSMLFLKAALVAMGASLYLCFLIAKDKINNDNLVLGAKTLFKFSIISILTVFLVGYIYLQLYP